MGNHDDSDAKKPAVDPQVELFIERRLQEKVQGWLRGLGIGSVLAFLGAIGAVWGIISVKVPTLAAEIADKRLAENQRTREDLAKALNDSVFKTGELTERQRSAEEEFRQLRQNIDALRGATATDVDRAVALLRAAKDAPDVAKAFLRLDKLESLIETGDGYVKIGTTLICFGRAHATSGLPNNPDLAFVSATFAKPFIDAVPMVVCPYQEAGEGDQWFAVRHLARTATGFTGSVKNLAGAGSYHPWVSYVAIGTAR